MDIVDALCATDGVVCVVGAGGKKTTMYALANRLDRAVVTATVRIPIFDEHVAAVEVTTDPVSALENARAFPLGLVPALDRHDRYRGYAPGVVDDLAGHADVVLVKADGARMRSFKAPGEKEPQLPSSTDVVLPIASVQAVGEPLTADVVHRPDRVAALTALDVGEEIRPVDVATVLASPEGGLKDVPPGATVIPLLNQVDDADWERVGRDVADAIHDRVDVPRVVLASMISDDPLVDVIE